MPEWFQHVEEESVSFRASNDLYNKFIGFFICAVSINGEPKEPELFIKSCVNSQIVHADVFGIGFSSSGLENTSFALYAPSLGSGVVDFGQIDGSYVQFRLQVFGPRLKKWGFRIICKQLEDDLKVQIQDNQLMDPALLFEVDHDSTDLEAESSHVHEVNPIETDLQEDMQDCQMSTEEHSPTISERNQELSSIETCEQRPLGLLIQLAEMSIAALARCFCS